VAQDEQLIPTVTASLRVYLSLPIISPSLSNICTVAVVAWNHVHTFTTSTSRDHEPDEARRWRAKRRN